MNLSIQGHRFIVGGASAGFGRAISEMLVAEGASILAVARNTKMLLQLQAIAPERIDILGADLTDPSAIGSLLHWKADREIHGILVNAGGPPAKTFMETQIQDWDNAYKNLLRWKVELAHAFVPFMLANGYGRMVFIESSSVKQPLENLVLSSSLRLAVTGFVKTLSQEISRSGVTLNVLAPGSHDTDAIERVYRKKSEQTGLAVEEVRRKAAEAIPVGMLGDPRDLASLAVWLLSPHSRYITGQTISVDGGQVRGIFG
jgi:3-oxoacyl-[acyl-carrier protein] reductase